jgi:multidrug efflux pump subunit AcrA (membrane-fusion protein)
MKRVLKVMLSILLLAAAVLFAARLIKTRPQARRTPRTVKPPIVKVVTVSSGTERIGVTGMGTVIPARVLTVQPEISGRVIDYHQGLTPGGRVTAGEEIVSIDPRDYELAVEQQRANVERARVEMRLEAGRRSLAEEEWKLFEGDVPFTQEGRYLALRKPQQRNAEISLEAATSGLRKAELNVERTRIVAPFNALVIEEAVEMGQLITPQSRLATLAGTDQFWVRVAIPPERIDWVRFESGDGTHGARAVITQETSGQGTITREGRVLRLLGDLDSAGRMARVIVAVSDPLDTRRGERLPLLLGRGEGVSGSLHSAARSTERRQQGVDSRWAEQASDPGTGDPLENN